MVALFFSPGGNGLLSCRYMRKFVRIRLGLHGIPSVHRLIPEVASSYTKTFPLTINWLRSRSCGRRKQWARAPVKHASKMISASLVVSMCPRQVGTHAGALPTCIALSTKRRTGAAGSFCSQGKVPNYTSNVNQRWGLLQLKRIDVS